MQELTRLEEILLLAIWRQKGEAYGVKIRQYVSNALGKNITYGNLYSALNQLVKKKYVSKTLGEPTPERRGRRKIYYTVTPLGSSALKATWELNAKLWAGVSKYAFEQKR